MSIRHALVTGASRGIGRALVTELLGREFNVVGTSRSGNIDEPGHAQLSVEELDLSNLESVERTSAALINRGLMFDLVINNAGIGPDLDREFPDAHSFQQTFDVNVKGTVFFTESIVGLIKDGGKLINVSSKMGSMGLCQLSDSVAYRMSKSALNMYTTVLAQRHRDQMKVASVHPGFVRTSIAESSVNGRLSPEESARNIMEFIESDFRTGMFWDAERAQELEW